MNMVFYSNDSIYLVGKTTLLEEYSNIRIPDTIQNILHVEANYMFSSPMSLGIAVVNRIDRKYYINMYVLMRNRISKYIIDFGLKNIDNIFISTTSVIFIFSGRDIYYSTFNNYGTTPEYSVDITEIDK
jgi:hypothetical protein